MSRLLKHLKSMAKCDMTAFTAFRNQSASFLEFLDEMEHGRIHVVIGATFARKFARCSPLHHSRDLKKPLAHKGLRPCCSKGHEIGGVLPSQENVKRKKDQDREFENK